jgi:hypothetical protein
MFDFIGRRRRAVDFADDLQWSGRLQGRDNRFGLRGWRGRRA